MNCAWWRMNWCFTSWIALRAWIAPCGAWIDTSIMNCQRHELRLMAHELMRASWIALRAWIDASHHELRLRRIVEKVGTNQKKMVGKNCYIMINCSMGVCRRQDTAAGWTILRICCVVRPDMRLYTQIIPMAGMYADTGLTGFGNRRLTSVFSVTAQRK